MWPSRPQSDNKLIKKATFCFSKGTARESKRQHIRNTSAISGNNKTSLLIIQKCTNYPIYFVTLCISLRQFVLKFFFSFPVLQLNSYENHKQTKTEEPTGGASILKLFRRVEKDVLTSEGY